MTAAAKVYEKLGAFYLGKTYDLGADALLDELLLYDSKDLTTHAVCVGMTGSGKTGLCVGLLEEAAIDGIPALVIDPKGDLTNLLLTFPDLAAKDFAPWVNEDDARREGVTPAQFAAGQAKLWKDGLGKWDQDGDRIRRLRDAAEFSIFTPGSEAGIPVSVLSSFDVPPPAVMADMELYRDRIGGTVTGLLGLLGIDADPIRSREHILLSTILDNAWRQGQSLDLGALIRLIQSPPVTRIGVLDVDSFFPAKDRFGLAMSLNNLLAAPGFETWMAGEPLDIDQMLRTPEGKPRISICSIAHLSDPERMFFVSLLLNQMLGWMRSRPGTTSLRALLYMDEIFGYLPPVAEPPSKKPLLTMLKQARAFGVGVVLATQNPVDLDYKALSNCGTWFIGRLQTERDKQRVLEGLEGASAGTGAAFDRGRMEETLAGLGKRVFLMHNVHETEPVTFQTRWAMSYLRGPLTRNQIRTLAHPSNDIETLEPSFVSPGVAPGAPLTSPAYPQPTIAPPHAPPGYAQPTVAAPHAPPGYAQPHAPMVSTAPAGGQRPVVPPRVPQFFLPVRQGQFAGRIQYRPRLLGIARVNFVDTRKGLEAEESLSLLAAIEDGPLSIDWSEAAFLELDADELQQEPVGSSGFSELPARAVNPRSYPQWTKAFADWVYRKRRYELFKSQNLREFSMPGESERDFRIRIGERAREERDLQVAKLRKRYATKFNSLRERIRRAEMAVHREQEQASGAKLQTVISVGTTLLSALLGRNAVSAATIGKATTAARGVGRASRQAQDVDRARQNLEAYQGQLDTLEEEFQAETEKIGAKLDPMTEVFSTIALKPRKVDIDVQVVALAWTPYGRAADGSLEPAYV